MSVTTSIIDTVSAWITGLLGFVSTAITGVVELFYDAETGLTTLGILGLMGLAMGLVRLGIRFVQRFFVK